MGIFGNIFKKKSNSSTQIEANRKVIYQLKSHGDNLKTEREVFHWIYFKTDSDLEKYVSEVELKGFEIVTENKIDGKFPHQLQIKRVDKVDLESVNDYTLYLWNLALENNGDYDGWETSVEE